jgi:hypothetical protein
MMFAPARLIAMIPSIQAASSCRNSGPTTTSPSGLNSNTSVRCLHRGRHRIDETVDPECQPRIGQDLLKATNDA